MHQKWGKNYTHNESKIDLKVVNLMWNPRWPHDHNLDYAALGSCTVIIKKGEKNDKNHITYAA